MSDWNAGIVEEFRANEGRVGGPFEGAPMILIHHIGARSGTERVTPLVYLPEAHGTMLIVASTGGESLQRLGRIDEDTLVIALSAGRAHPLLLRAMKLAVHRRARTLAISDATLSEVGELAEMTLYYSSNSPSFARSNTALMALVQALAHGVYARDEAAHRDRIRAYKLK